MAEQTEQGNLEPWLYRRSDENTVFLFDTPGTDLEVDAEEDPSGEEDQEAEPPFLVTPEVDGTAETPKGFNEDEDEEDDPPSVSVARALSTYGPVAGGVQVRV